MGPIFRRPSVNVHKGSSKKNFLLIGDAHVPFHNPKSLKFLKDVQALYQIPEDNVICLGDFLDLYSFSRWPKSPDAPVTVNQEIEGVRQEIKKWVQAFPKLTITQGNHDNRIWRKAIGADLPSQVVRSIHEVFDLPKSWELHECALIQTKSPFLCVHGDGHGISPTTLQTNPRQHGVSVAFGHFHSRASIMHINTIGLGDVWSFHVGCLVDQDSFAFEYGSKAAFKPSLGCGVVLDEGRCPIFIPMPT